MSFLINPYQVVPSGTWQTEFTGGLNANGTGLNGVNYHYVIGQAAMSISGSKVRITFAGPSSGEACKTSACYIAQLSGDGPTQVTMDGGTGAIEVAAGATKLSDEITFALDQTKDLYISWYFNDASKDDYRQNFSSPNGNVFVYVKTAADDSANPTNSSGYAAQGKEVLVSLLEVFA